MALRPDSTCFSWGHRSATGGWPAGRVWDSSLEARDWISRRGPQQHMGGICIPQLLAWAVPGPPLLFYTSVISENFECPRD